MWTVTWEIFVMLDIKSSRYLQACSRCVVFMMIWTSYRRQKFLWKSFLYHPLSFDFVNGYFFQQQRYYKLITVFKVTTYYLLVFKFAFKCHQGIILQFTYKWCRFKNEDYRPLLSEIDPIDILEFKKGKWRKIYHQKQITDLYHKKKFFKIIAIKKIIKFSLQNGAFWS